MATLARLSDSNVRGSDASAVRPVDVNTTWNPSSLQASIAARRKEDAAVSRPAQLPANGFPLPQKLYGYPSGAKGAIYALNPNDASKGDVLYFSRFPEALEEEIEATLAQEFTPGRSFQAFQQMGAKGVKLSTELWFCDAFLWGRNLQTSVGEITSQGQVKAQATLAEEARLFFEFYCAGHDGTGMSLPPADLYLHWGDRELPVPIVIERVKMRQENFTSAGPRPYKKPGSPQTVTVHLDMWINIPLRMSDPFKPKRPHPGKKPGPKVRDCVYAGEAPDGTTIAFSVLKAAIWHVYGGDTPKGFAPPSAAAGSK